MTNALIRNIYRNLIPTRLKGSIDLFRHLRKARIEGLDEKRVLVLAPHPDDDIIGCGGALRLYHERGATITTVYMTDGRRGGEAEAGEDLVSIRQSEAERAAAIIGIDDLVFLSNKDGELSTSRNAAVDLGAIIRDFVPEAVFLPFLLDDHPDHMATSRVFLSAIKSTPEVLCYCYGVWTPLPAFNVVVDVTPYQELKERALREHRSQIRTADLLGAVSGLSRYYSAVTGGRGYAEVFMACGSHEYRRLGELVRW